MFVRELLQNGVDAITARRAVDPDAPAGPIRLFPSDARGAGALLVHDPGIGLTVDEVHTFLATIGSSTKRDELDLPRSGYLGRFGVGLLSGFVVAEQIEVLTRSVEGPTVVRFVGGEDGAYDVGPIQSGDNRVAAEAWEILGDGPGTVVRLAPRPGLKGMTESRTVVQLAAEFGAILPIPVLVEQAGGTTVDVADHDPVWRRPDPPRPEAIRWCESAFGFTPLDLVPIEVPSVGLRGTAFVQPTAVSPGANGGHLVYLRRMLVSDAATGLLPDWAFFLRCAVDADELHPTASRETLVDDDALAAARESLDVALRHWLVRLATTDAHRFAALLQIHGQAAKALAIHDPAVLEAIGGWLTVDTSEGEMTLVELGRRTTVVRFVRTVDRFRQLSPIARAQGLVVANGGFSYDTELLECIGTVVPGASAVELGDDDIVAVFDAVDPTRREAGARFEQVAAVALEEVGCTVALHAFDPHHVPALFLHDPEATRRRQLRTAESEVDPTWAALLREFDDGGDDRPRLVCNDRHPLVAHLVDQATDQQVVVAAVQALYGQALLLGHFRLRPADLALQNRALMDLVAWATGR